MSLEPGGHDSPGYNLTIAPSAGDEHVSAAIGPAGASPGHNGSFEIDGDHAHSHARVLSDGRVDVSIFHKKTIAHVLRAALNSQEKANESLRQTPSAMNQFKEVPKLNIVIQIVGSRGDVQPFIALAKVLVKEPYGHRVRFCTHPIFKDFVEENGLEFFSIGGDPAQLMAYMVKNPGLVPGIDSIRAGDIQKRRAGVAENLRNAWRSCIEPSDSEQHAFSNKNMSRPGRTFIADAIIANPPSFAHLHCAEKLHIPLHLMFTMPWSPTQAFPHPLANIKASNVDHAVSNFLSYGLMDLMTWQGIGDLINNFRVETLQLEPISAIWGGGLVSRLQVPFTYCWSDALIPKPRDWGPNINIAGFYFLDGASNYKPPQELVDFLNAGEPPVYIGFGSIVVADPEALTNMIFTAIKNAGVRALVSKGWGKLGGFEVPEGVHLLGNVPHDWLFPRVSAVVHHGGAGTTATGIASGKPTVVVPFFGDQGFWGAMIARAGAGPDPVPFKQMTAESLTKSIQFALKPETLGRAKELAQQIQNEDGKEEGARLFCESLDVNNMRCMLEPRRVAVWHVKHTKLRLSAFAATVLAKENILKEHDLYIIRHKQWNLDEGPEGPLSGSIAALVGSLTDFMLGIGHLSHTIGKASLHELQHPFHLIPRPNRGSHMDSPENENVTGHSTPLIDDQHLSIVQEKPNDSNKEKAQSNSVPSKKSHNRWLKAQTNPMHLQSRRRIASVFPGFLYNKGDGPSSVYFERRRRAKLEHLKPVKETEEDPPSVLTREYIMDILSTTGKITKVIVKLPMEITYNIANGFHNAPILFLGDETVRKHYKITGVASGLVAAGREFTLGFYDGITGLVIHPYQGAKHDGTAGLLKGVVRGFGGLLLKTQAGVWAIPGYSFKGIHKELRKMKGPGIHSYVRGTRIIQGLREYDASNVEERETILKRWEHLNAQLKN